jgi:fermentation-respiration switch protein FrsA (DUF1100 family)
MRRDIEFRTEDGVLLRGWHYAAGPATVVMAHGFSAVKEMHLDDFAEVFAAAGLSALVFDHRGFGASGGTPRGEADPMRQIRDYRDAITFALTLPGTDPARIGAWGSSYSGGHVLALAAIDRRVKCAVSQVPLTSGSRNIRRTVRADLLPGMRTLFDADRAARFTGAAPAMLPVVGIDPAAPVALASADAHAWFTATAAARAPAWLNAVTLRSIEMYGEYEPAAQIARISPTPLLMLVAENDVVAMSDLAFEAYESALEPKKLVVLKGGHFDAYTGPGFAVASAAARDWFRTHLAPEFPPARSA